MNADTETSHAPFSTLPSTEYQTLLASGWTDLCKLTVSNGVEWRLLVRRVRAIPAPIPQTYAGRLLAEWKAKAGV